jgi:hypothetical protein
MMRLLSMLAVIAAILAAPVEAKQGDTGFVQFRKEEPVTIKQDKAYLLVRQPDAKNNLLLLRVPSEAELAAYEAAKRAEYDRKERKTSYEEFVFEWEEVSNFYSIKVTHHYARPEKNLRVLLVEVPPGEYVLYGVGYANILYSCHCQGSVGFTAEPGKITDLGTSLVAPAWEPSPYPELTKEADLGRIARMDFGLFAATIRPLKGGEFVPSQLEGAEIVAADYRAIGPWIDTRRVHANRLGAIPGVLEYREGIAYDPVAQRELRLPDIEY